MIGEQFERFSRIARARGKSAARPGRVRARDNPVFAIPILVALFQLAEDLSAGDGGARL